MDKDEIYQLIEVIGSQSKPLTTTRSIVFSCPFAIWKHSTGGDSNPSFSIDIRPGEQSFCRCFTCHTHGPVEEAMAEYSVLKGDAAIEEALPWIAKVNAPDLENRLRHAMGQIGKSVDTFAENYKVFSDSEFSRFEGGVPKYALDRGLTLDTCRRWRMGYDKTLHAPRLVFTVRDWRNRLVGMVGRSVVNGHSNKYKNYWGFPRSELLYGEQFHDEGKGPLLLVEGMIDANLVDQWCTNVQVMGIFGNLVTRAQKEKILRFAGIGPIYTLYDEDLGGDEARDNTDRVVGKGIAVFHARVPTLPPPSPGLPNEKNDPAKAGCNEVRKALETVGLVVAREDVAS